MTVKDIILNMYYSYDIYIGTDFDSSKYFKNKHEIPQTLLHSYVKEWSIDWDKQNIFFELEDLRDNETCRY